MTLAEQLAAKYTRHKTESAGEVAYELDVELAVEDAIEFIAQYWVNRAGCWYEGITIANAIRALKEKA